MGKEVALLYAQAGMKLVLADVNMKGLEDTAKETGVSWVYLIECLVT